ncbi:MAG: hypothetical protein EOQ34_15640 [Mesorhizobium sp.]|nr:hypothetical protein [Mesorhizobium sp.]RWF71378.1 MAG: hypothetical protein EOQ34_15640 [Mesorhizobium sp.]TIR63179.1 MAG: hypothetical protein E5X28_02330 [Mesorhizobium sp.]
MSALIPHIHDEIPADIMKAATHIAYAAETGVVVGSFPGAVYIARAILAERERNKAIADGYATSPSYSEAENLIAGRIADAISLELPF